MVGGWFGGVGGGDGGQFWVGGLVGERTRYVMGVGFVGSEVSMGGHF